MPLVTLLLVALNVLAYRLELASGGLSFCEAHGLVPARFVHTGNAAPLVESLFLHDPSSLSHLAGNMVFLAVFGAVVERALGGVGFAALYLAAGVAGGLLHVQVDPSSTVALVGASGAIFGVLAVAAAIRPGLTGFAVVFAGIEVFHAFSGASSGVSWGCHLGGFAAGVVAAVLLRAVGSEAMEPA